MTTEDLFYPAKVEDVMRLTPSAFSDFMLRLRTMPAAAEIDWRSDGSTWDGTAVRKGILHTADRTVEVWQVRP